MLSGFICICASLAANSAEEIRIEADALREKGESLEALHLYNQAIFQLQREKNYSQMLDTLSGRYIAWQHLYFQEGESAYLIFAKKDAEAMQEIADIYAVEDKNHLIHFFLAKSAMLTKDYSSAQREFELALSFYPVDHAEIGDWLVHLGDAVYRNGKKEEGKARILEGIRKIESHSNETDSFLKNVWISGAYLKLYKLLDQDQPEEAKRYLALGQEIVKNDPRLVIRREQFEGI